MPTILFYMTSVPASMKLKSDIDRIKYLLDTKGVEYEEVDLSIETLRKEEMIAASGERKIPQLHVDGKLLGDAEAIQEMEDYGELNTALGITK